MGSAIGNFCTSIGSMCSGSPDPLPISNIDPNPSNEKPSEVDNCVSIVNLNERTCYVKVTSMKSRITSLSRTNEVSGKASMSAGYAVASLNVSGETYSKNANSYNQEFSVFIAAGFVPVYFGNPVENHVTQQPAYISLYIENEDKMIYDNWAKDENYFIFTNRELIPVTESEFEEFSAVNNNCLYYTFRVEVKQRLAVFQKQSKLRKDRKGTTSNHELMPANSNTEKQAAGYTDQKTIEILYPVEIINLDSNTCHIKVTSEKSQTTAMTESDAQSLQLAISGGGAGFTASGSGTKSSTVARTYNKQYSAFIKEGFVQVSGRSHMKFPVQRVTSFITLSDKDGVFTYNNWPTDDKKFLYIYGKLESVTILEFEKFSAENKIDLVEVYKSFSQKSKKETDEKEEQIIETPKVEHGEIQKAVLEFFINLKATSEEANTFTNVILEYLKSTKVL